MLPSETIARFRVDQGSDFKLGDPKDMGGLDIEKPEGEELLAAAVEAGDHRPHGRRVDAVLHDQWVRSLHPFDRLAGEAGDPAPRQLDLQHLRHGTSLANEPGNRLD